MPREDRRSRALAVALLATFALSFVLFLALVVVPGTTDASVLRWRLLSPGPFSITDHLPITHAVGVSLTAPITATFDGDLDATTVTSRTFLVHGNLTGLYTDTYAYSAGTRTLAFTPSRAFFIGEEVRVHATAGISNTIGESLQPAGWQFTAGNLEPGREAHFIREVRTQLPKRWDSSSVSWGDYDNDGDLDVLLTGWIPNLPWRISSLHRNNGDGTFTDMSATASFHGVCKGSSDWGDYDNDGDLDIVLGGEAAVGLGTKVYRNNGDGTFTDMLVVGLGSTNYPAPEWGDYDNDGDLDLLIIGCGGSKVCRNDGPAGSSWTFTNIGAGLPTGYDGDGAWGDYDNDGDLDIVVIGYSSRIFRNDGADTFTELAVGLPDAQSASVAWGDYDNDGDLDILCAGLTKEGTHIFTTSRVYRNNGDGTFTDIDAGLAGVWWCSVAWGDCDNDGDLDILIAGEPSTKVYRNDGDQTFTNIKAGLPRAEYGDVAWGDYDNDGDLDILITGEDGGGILPTIYRNDGSPHVTGQDPSMHEVGVEPAAPIEAEFDGDMDVTTVTSQTLAVHGHLTGLFAGTYAYDGPDRTLVFTPTRAYHTGETVRVHATGGISDTHGTPLTPYGWEFTTGPVTNRCVTGFTDIGAALSDVDEGSVAWGDYDGDGDLDAVVTGYASAPVSKVYRNKGNGTFQDMVGSISLVGVHHSSVDWGDYDNDGDLDLVLTGRDASSQPTTRLYRNDGPTSFTDMSGVYSLTDVHHGSLDWGDYDNDGDLDILLTGYDGAIFVSKVYRNDDSGFSDMSGAITLQGVAYGSAAWGDYDNDGDLDILIAGGNATKVYSNQGNDTFSDIGASLQLVTSGSAAWGDYDNDGDLDILLTGRELLGTLVSKLYRNDGVGASPVFAEVATSLTPVADGSVAWGDCDNDGDLDILITGEDQLSNPVCQVYTNEGGGVFVATSAGGTLTDLTDSSAAWGDYDNDGDLDILLIGHSASGQERSIIYRNDDCLVITDHRPVMNELAVSPGRSITATFNMEVDAGTVTSSTFYVNGHLTGRYTDTVTYDPGSLTVTLDPTRDYHAGERIRAHGTDGIERPGGWGLHNYGWQFTAGVVVPGREPHFTDMGDVGLIPIGRGMVEWGDYDNDGDLDVAVSGSTDAAPHWLIRVYRNNGDGTFSKQWQYGSEAWSYGDLAWGDYDNDGDLDILVCGVKVDGTTRETRIFRNEGDGTFTEVNPGLVNVENSAVDWGDYDSDGDLDIAIAGLGAGGYRAKIYRNDGGGSFFDISATATITGLNEADVAWGDYDNDGDLDLALIGADGGGLPSASLLYRNLGDDYFTEVISSGFSIFCGFQDGSLEWGDFEGDGDLDILVSGGAGGNSFCKVYRNDGTGHFEDASAGLPASIRGCARFGDYDNDGDLDVFVIKYDMTRVYRNNGDGTFTNINAGLATMSVMIKADMEWGDYDNDGDLDILYVGDDLYDEKVYLYQNSSLDPDPAVTKTVESAVVAPGERITYTIAYSNAALGTCTGVVLTDIVPVTVTNLSFVSSGATITRTPGITYEWQVDDLGPDDGGLITITGEILGFCNPTAFVITNTATISSTSSDGILGNSVADAVATLSASTGPSADFGASPTSCCAPLTVSFTDGSTPGDSPIAERGWDFGDESTSSQSNPEHIYTTAGTYTVTLTVTDT